MADANVVNNAPATTTKKKIVHNYSEEVNVVMCRQILAERPYQFKKYLGELTQTWNKITDALTATYHDLNVNTRNIRDHLDALLKSRTKQWNAEKRLSGVDIETTELECLLDTIQEDFEGCTAALLETTEKEKAKLEADKKAAEDVRNASLSTYKRHSSLNQSLSSESDASSPPPKAKRRTGSETMAFLMSAKYMKQMQHEEEIKLRIEEM